MSEGDDCSEQRAKRTVDKDSIHWIAGRLYQKAIEDSARGAFQYSIGLVYFCDRPRETMFDHVWSVR